MAHISYLRPASAYERRLLAYDRLGSRGRARRPIVPIAIGLALVAALVAAGIVVSTSSASVTADGPGLAAVGMPIGGGTLGRVTVTTGPHGAQVPVVVRANEVWPRKPLPAGQRVSIVAIVKRPGWISWLGGSTERVTLGTVTPSAQLRSRFLTLSNGAPLRVAFDKPVRTVTYGTVGAVRRRVLASAQDSITLPRPGRAGSVMVAGAPRTWERAIAVPVSWFPAGLARASAVANPNPGARLTPDEPITLTFSQPVTSVLGKNHPAITAGTGSWKVLSSHVISFQPSGSGYGLGATVKLGLPAGVALVGATNDARGARATWRVPPGSIVRLHQLLAQLGYLPVTFHYAGKPPASTPQAQLAAAVNPPKGTFTWRYPNIPAALRSDWSPTASGVVTKGAIMAFEANQGLISSSYASPFTDGVATPAVWRALIKAATANQRSTFGYTFVTVSEGSPETETTWHDGKVVVHGLVNTGISSAPTAQGTFPTFTHLRVTTMSGTNPDGSHYSDPGIPYTSYFNGGDALHGFIRASYGFPQSLGCVEMPFS
ncbi:MAG: L,D-transpeptidase, partial [Solirubrobacterales bacterium]|nr:L,D-transpeptidase [Solirubrobacterales bacterium]